MRIGLMFARTRAFGRRFCEGVASLIDEHPDWELVMLEPDDLKDTRKLHTLDALITHVMDDETDRRLDALKIPIVKDYYFRAKDSITDHDSIGRLAAEHFIARGFTHFAFCGYNGVFFSDAREAAFKKYLSSICNLSLVTCNSYNTPPKALRGFSERVILREELTPRAVDHRELVRWLKRLPLPCAVFCCHDLRAQQVLTAAKELGLRVPEDLAILGVDNDVLICNFTSPRLSSIDNNGYECGRAVFKSIETPPKGIVERDSTRVFTYEPKWLNDALSFIHQHLAENISAADVFKAVNLSHTVVTRTFNKVLGTTVQAEIARLRLEKAQRLLSGTNLTIGEIAALSGFASIRYFSQAYKAAFHHAPSTHR